MLLIVLDRSSPDPLFRQIRDRIAEMVEEGSVRPGDRLPPTRVLAGRVGVHRSTVIRAYDELRAAGYVEGRPGSYTTVRRRSRLPRTRMRETGEPSAGEDSFDWIPSSQAPIASLGSHPAMETVRPRPVPGRIDLEHLSADPALAPDHELRRCLRHVMAKARGAVLDYADAAGWYPFRETVARRLGHHGVAVSPEEVLITAGAQQALDLILRLLVKAGDAVAVEAPTYGMGHALLRLHGARPLEIPMLRDGMDLDRLEGVLATEKPRLVFTMPNFQNPTGITTPQPHRERLLSLCETYGVPMVEDGFEEEMKYFGQAVLPVKSMDARGTVLYVGTLSKVIFPGLRLGWIAAPRSVIGLLTDVQHATCLAGNTLAQAAAAHFMSAGAYELYLRRIHRVFRQRIRTMLRALKEHVPEECSWTEPDGGYLVWLTLPSTRAKEADIVQRCMEAGVQVSAGNRYFLRPSPQPHLRLSISRANSEEIEEGCRRLGEVLAEVVSASARSAVTRPLPASSRWRRSAPP